MAPAPAPPLSWRHAASPDLTEHQTYFGPAPTGIDGLFARAQPGGDGRGVRDRGDRARLGAGARGPRPRPRAPRRRRPGAGGPRHRPREAITRFTTFEATISSEDAVQALLKGGHLKEITPATDDLVLHLAGLGDGVHRLW